MQQVLILLNHNYIADLKSDSDVYHKKRNVYKTTSPETSNCCFVS